MQGCHATVPSTSTSDCKSDTLSVSDKEVPKLIPTLQLEAEELEQVANKSKLILQSETTEKMKQLVVSAENNEENPTEKHPNIITKDETNI